PPRQRRWIWLGRVRAERLRGARKPATVCVSFLNGNSCCSSESKCGLQSDGIGGLRQRISPAMAVFGLEGGEIGDIVANSKRGLPHVGEVRQRRLVSGHLEIIIAKVRLPLFRVER